MHCNNLCIAASLVCGEVNVECQKNTDQVESHHWVNRMCCHCERDAARFKGLFCHLCFRYWSMACLFGEKDFFFVLKLWLRQIRKKFVQQERKYLIESNSAAERKTQKTCISYWRIAWFSTFIPNTSTNDDDSRKKNHPIFAQFTDTFSRHCFEGN